MKEDEFWQIIERARKESDSCETLAESVTRQLHNRGLDAVMDYQSQFSSFMDRAYRADLWDIFSIINGGCGDDGFEYFRAWLISQGQRAYEQAVSDPTTLPDLLYSTIPWHCEELLYAALRAYKALTGAESPPKGFVKVPPPLIGDLTPDDELPERYPTVWQRMLEEEEGG